MYTNRGKYENKRASIPVALSPQGSPPRGGALRVPRALPPGAEHLESPGLNNKNSIYELTLIFTFFTYLLCCRLFFEYLVPGSPLTTLLL